MSQILTRIVHNLHGHRCICSLHCVIQNRCALSWCPKYHLHALLVCRPLFVTARIRRMREGNSLTMFVSAHLDGRGGGGRRVAPSPVQVCRYPSPHLARGYPIKSQDGGGTPYQSSIACTRYTTDSMPLAFTFVFTCALTNVTIHVSDAPEHGYQNLYPLIGCEEWCPWTWISSYIGGVFELELHLANS